MSWVQWVAAVLIVTFVVPFFVYLFSRLQMVAWLNAFDDWIKRKGKEADEEDKEED